MSVGASNYGLYCAFQGEALGKLVSLSSQPEHESFVLDARHDSIVVSKPKVFIRQSSFQWSVVANAQMKVPKETGHLTLFDLLSFQYFSSKM